MRRIHELAGLVVLTAVLAAIGWLLICTTFMIYDDEGYVLLTQFHYLQHGRLYDDVFTQYGPVPYAYFAALHHLIGLPPTHVATRVLTVTHWLVTALACGLLAWRLSQRYWTALFTTVITFGYLWQMTSEPGHPGGLIAASVAVGAWLAVEGVQRGRPSWTAAALGATSAWLLLTKINVGLLWLCGAGAFALMASGGEKFRRTGRLLATAGMALLPFVLMRPLLGESWVQIFALVFALSAGVICWLAGRDSIPVLGRSQWLAGAGLFLLVTLAVAADILARGTTLHGLLDGVVLGPLRHPAHFRVALNWLPTTWPMLVFGVGLPLAQGAVRSSAWQARLGDVIACARLGAFVWFLCGAQAWLTVHGVGWLIYFALPLAPLFLAPLAASGHAAPAIPPARGLLALLAVGQVLHAFPVAGTQMGWATFLLLPLYVVGLGDAARHIAARFPRMPLRRLPEAVAGLALAAAGLQIYWLGDTGWQRYRTSEPLELKGAEPLRLPENIRSSLRIFTWNASIHTDLLFSRPGMFSFNLWSEVPTPTLRNTTHWFWLLGEADQQAIVARLQATPRSAVITSQPLTELLEQLKVPSMGPLDGFLANHYRRLITLTDYEFWVPRSSTAVPFFLAEALVRDGAPAAPREATERNLLNVNVAADTDIAEIILRDVRDPAQILLRLHQGNCRLAVQPITSAGQPTGAAAPLPLPGRLRGLCRLSIYFNEAPAHGFRRHHELVFLGADGRARFEARFSAPPRSLSDFGVRQTPNGKTASK